MSATAEKATRREIRRAFGERAVANVAALDQRLTQAEAEIVALRLKVATLEKAHPPHARIEYGIEPQAAREVNICWASNGDEA